MNTMNENIKCAKALLLLCWYLEHGDDFSATTRSDMIETAVAYLGNLSPEERNLLRQAEKELIDEYSNHPLQEIVRTQLALFLAQVLDDPSSEAGQSTSNTHPDRPK
jgi:hypothetical protein